MGMFDREPNLASQEWVKEPFDLMRAEYIGLVKSADFGENRKARVWAIPPGEDAPATFAVYGVLAEQISRMESGELPAKVRVAKEGRAHVFVSVGESESGL